MINVNSVYKEKLRKQGKSNAISRKLIKRRKTTTKKETKLQK